MHRRNITRAGVVAAVGAISLVAGSSVASAAPAAAKAGATKTSLAKSQAKPQLGPGGRVIVLLKNQTTSAMAKTSALRVQATAAHSAVSEVSGRISKSGGTVSTSYSLINAVSAKLTQSQADALAADGNVAQIVPDAVIHEAAADANSAASTPPETTPAPGVCPTDPNSVQLGPEALRVTNADSDVPGAKTARSLGYDGTGVKVAFMAEGIDINNPDFIRNGHSIFSDYKDFSGDGLNVPTSGGEAFLDASAIAAQGNKVYDVSHFSARVLDRACKIRVEGEAPGVSLVGLKVFGEAGSTTTSGFLQAIEYAVNVDHVNILSQSFGGSPLPSTAQDVTAVADAAAIAAGVTVVASTGDAGITNTISSPADGPGIIAAGASTTYQFDLQTGYAAARLPGIRGWLDNNISSLSSSGFDTTAGTTTLVAPGELNYAVCSTDLTMYQDCADYAGNAIGLEASGGTSESAPIISGVAALVIQAYKQGHGGAVPTPAQVEDILTSSATDISAPAEQQGAGLVNAYAAVKLAKAFGSTTTSTTPVIQSSASSFTATAAPSTKETFTDTVTNHGSTTQKVAVSGRSLGAYSRIATTTTTLSDASSPKYVDFQGLTDNVSTIKFTVPAGVDRLSDSIAWQAASLELAARVRMTIVDPQGRLAAYSLPQGIGNYGHVEVANPVAGTWTAYITSRLTKFGGTEGAVRFAASVASYGSFATISPSSLTLAPGKSGTVKVTTFTNSTPGDRAGSLVLTPAGGTATTIPVTLRSTIPAGFQRFSQTLTGPNGRDEYPGVVFHYAVVVPAGTPELNAAVHLPGNPNAPYQAELVSPSGDIASFGSSIVNTTAGLAQNRGAQLHVISPATGTWSLIVDFAPTVSGTTITTPFTVTTDDRARTATAAGLPDSSSVTLKAGKAVTVQVKVKNTGPSPESFFVDGRLSGTITYKLPGLTGDDTQAPIGPGVNQPLFLVPTHTTQLTESLTTTGSKAVQFDTSWGIGDPDLESTAGTTATVNYATSSGTYVPQGLWGMVPDQVGPYAVAPKPEPATASASVTTAPFDPAVTSTTGDLWLQGLDATSPLATVTVAPGQTATIPVTIKPTGGHRVVSGTLYVDDYSNVANEYGFLGQQNGSEVVALPYTYTVG